MRVPRLELEERVFGAIRERVVGPEAVAEAVEHAMALVAEIPAALAGSPEHCRAAFRALLGPDGRMRVHSDAERRFRVVGLFELELETIDAPARDGVR